MQAVADCFSLSTPSLRPQLGSPENSEAADPKSSYLVEVVIVVVVVVVVVVIVVVVVVVVVVGSSSSSSKRPKVGCHVMKLPLFGLCVSGL